MSGTHRRHSPHMHPFPVQLHAPPSLQVAAEQRTPISRSSSGEYARGMPDVQEQPAQLGPVTTRPARQCCLTCGRVPPARHLPAMHADAAAQRQEHSLRLQKSWTRARQETPRRARGGRLAHL